MKDIKPKMQLAAVREATIMSTVDHPNIVRFYTSFLENDSLYILMEHAQKGDLYKMLREQRSKKKYLSEKDLWDYAYQICKGVAHLHANNIMHRDIKPLNLLVDPTCHILKICDFGSSKKYQNDENSVTYMTSRYYRAPELMMGNKKYTKSIDIWSAGCVIAELVLGQPIFYGNNHKL